MPTYGPRVTAHPTRTGVRRNTAAIRLLIIHTSEGSEGERSAEALASFIASPRTASNLASYHYVFDTDRVIPVVPDDHVAFATGGANADGLAACYPGKANQTPEQWADAISAGQHEQAAQWLATKSAEYGIPLRRLLVSEIRAGARGVCGHIDVTLAYAKSTHTDPGPYYPWDSVLARARQIAAPVVKPPPVIQPPDGGDDDMATMYLMRGPSGQMYGTNRKTIGFPVSEDNGAWLRDNHGYDVAPDTGPWPIDAAEEHYIRVLAGLG